MQMKRPEVLAMFSREAVTTLGYIRADAADWFAAKMHHHIMGTPAREIMASGERLSPTDLAALGLGHWLTMGREAWEALAPRGRIDPEHAFEATCRRASGNYYRLVSLESWAEIGAEMTRHLGWAFTIWTTPECCTDAQVITGTLYDLEDLPALPLPSCRKEFCPCGYQKKNRKRR